MFSLRNLAVIMVLAVTAGSIGEATAQVAPEAVVMSGNNITTLVSATGVVSGPNEKVNDLVWGGTGYGYEFGFFIAAKVVDESGNTVRIVSDGLRSHQGERSDIDSTYWGFKAVRSHHRLDSATQDEELILVMNDFGNKEFDYHPDTLLRSDNFRSYEEQLSGTSGTSLGGLGIEVEVRVLQSNEGLMADALLLSYTVTNRGQKTLDSVVLGMWGDPHIGGADDFHDDFSAFDSALSLLTVWDENSGVGAARSGGLGFLGHGFLGYTFLPAIDSLDVGLASFSSHLYDSTTIANDALIWELVQPGMDETPNTAGDYVFLFGSTPISLAPCQSRRISSVLFFADNGADMPQKAKTLRDLFGVTLPAVGCAPGCGPCEDLVIVDTIPQPKPPTADFDFKQSDKTVHFNDKSIPGDDPIGRWLWDFGDGATSTMRNPDHDYDGTGEYAVTFVVEASDSSGTTTQIITVPDYCNCPRILEIGLDSIFATLINVQDTVRQALASVSLVGGERFLNDAGSSAISTLRDLTGVEVSEVGADRYQVALRGFNTPFDAKPYVMVDHRQGMIPGLGANIYSLLPIAPIDLQRAEIVREPVSAEYGSDADDGVIHFTTKNAFDHTGTTFSGDIGESETRSLSVRHAQKIGEEFAFKAVGHYSRAKELTFGEDDSLSQAVRDQLGLDSGEDKVWKAYARGSAVYRPCDCISFTANADLAAVNQNLPDFAGGGIFADNFKVATGQLLAETTRGFAQVYYSFTDRGESTEKTTGEPFVDNSNLFAAEVQYKILSHPEFGNVVAGFDYSNTTVANVSASDTLTPLALFAHSAPLASKTGSVDRTSTHSNPVSINRSAFHIDSRVPLPGGFDAHVTLRYDIQDATDQNFVSPRINIGMRPFEGHDHRLSVSYNRAFALNANVALYRGLFTLAGGAVDEIPPTITDLIEFSYHGQFPDQSRIGVDLYYMNRRDQITNVGPLFGNIIIPIGKRSTAFDEPADLLFNDVSYFGMDVEALLLFWTDWQFFGNFTLLSDNFFDSQDVSDIPPHFAVAMNTPRFRARAGFQRQLTPQISLRAVGRYADSYIVSHGFLLGETDRYLVLDVNLGFRMTGRLSGMRLDLTGRNLLDNEHREFVLVPEVGRTITARLTYEL